MYDKYYRRLMKPVTQAKDVEGLDPLDQQEGNLSWDVSYESEPDGTVP